MGRSRGYVDRLFDTVTRTKDGKTYTFEIRHKGEVGKPEFYVKELGTETAGFTFNSKVAEEAYAAIDEEMAGRTTIQWGPYIMLRITNDKSDVSGMKVALEWEGIVVGHDGRDDVWAPVEFLLNGQKEAGADPLDDAKAMQRLNATPRTWTGQWERERHGARYAQPNKGKPSIYDYEASKDHRDRTVAVLPATLETVNAVLLFSFQLRQVAGALKQLMSKERAAKTLALIAKGTNVLALPAKTEE